MPKFQVWTHNVVIITTSNLIIRNFTTFCSRTDGRYYSGGNMNERNGMSTEAPRVCLGVNS